jgi:hypothetical protein
MRKTFIPFGIISSFILLLLFTKCQKEYSYEGGPPATYSLSGSPGECVPVTVSGHYFAAISSDSSNFITVTANVTVTGNYTIFTVPLDGLSFSSSGNFTDTGSQAVVLSCSGIPDSAGSFIIKIPGDNGCFFTLNVQKQAPASYTLSGYPNDCQNPDIKGKYIAGEQLTDGTATLNVNITSPGNYTIKTDTVNGMSFSASGRFSTTGDQSVTLTASGTPDSPGLIFFTVTADSSQCSFSVSVTAANPLATYVLESGSGPSNRTICAPRSIQGTYIAGTPLTIGNTATISVFVTVPGNFSISTFKIDGMVFKLNGTFTTLGEQNVILMADGEPLSQGTYSFTPFIIGPAPLGGQSCDFDIDVQ